METKKLSLCEMEEIGGGSWGCGLAIAGFAFGAGTLITLNAATLGVGTFLFTAAGGWLAVIKGAGEIEQQCFN